MRHINKIPKKKNVAFIIFASFLLLSGLAGAHQPRIVSNDTTLIENPEVSQAFYGNLKGMPNYFRIASEKNFTLYVSILVPELKNISKDISAEVTSNSGLIFRLDGQTYNWKQYYEEFAGDYYYQGPDKKINAINGTYTITIYNPENTGKYVLVVGEKEEFPLSEMINAVITIPKLKQDFFEKSIFTAFFNRIGTYFTISILIVLAILFFTYKILKKIFIKRQ